VAPNVCPRCGQPLAPDAPSGLCASCLLVASAETLVSGSVDDLATMTSADVAGPRASDGPALAPGTLWGPYRIGRLLGRGGMGEVYEAEQLTSGRRVALKVLRSRLQTPDERARFLREGQLAASVSHPHTVYIFGSEEIEGTPAISMELLPGGTLKDVVSARGPMPPGDAVAAILDVIGGLDAAADGGILHRDIKPSNCFVDSDGTVKVGDFGLSISTLARDVRNELVSSGFEGTPQFAPPEQLRGEALDVRADIYAVGATLYYLLTGKAPFDAPDLRELFTRVSSAAPPSPRAVRREVPARLASVVLQCLAKTPADRPASYAALADALRPFVSRDDAPAPLWPRLIAFALDSWVIVGVPMSVVTALLNDPLTGRASRTLATGTWTWLATFAYYVAIEGTTGAALGKRLLGMRVIGSGGAIPAWRQTLVRNAIFFAPSALLWIGVASGVIAPATTWAFAVPPAVSLLIFFSTARRDNGWTGLHDVVSGTRVVARPVTAARRVRAPQMPAFATTAGTGRRYGPFVAADSQGNAPGSVVRAFDPILRRPVWIHIAAASAPPIDSARRDLSRTGRLHWLTGRRTAEESWDAYEAPDGVPFTTAVAGAHWSTLKLQLLDLTSELEAAERDGTMPGLSLDRLWLRANGRLILLDFTAPDVHSRADATLTPAELLAAVATRVPRGDAPDSLPLSAREMLEQWASADVPALSAARASVSEMSRSSDHVVWWRRALPGALAAAPVALMLLVSALLIPALGRFTSSDTGQMMNLLGALRSTTLPNNNPFHRPEVREAAEVLIAGRYSDMIGDEDFWASGIVSQLAPDYRAQAQQILARHPGVTREQVATAEATLAAAREERRVPGARRETRVVEMGAVVISFVTAGALAIVFVCLLISASAVPGGIVSRHLGLATVTRSGREISRMRSVVRALVASIPALVWFAYLAQSPRVQGFVPTPQHGLLATGLAVGLLAAGVVWTIVGRTRGPHDILLGTWVVPR
jgi:hypothetical protein